MPTITQLLAPTRVRTRHYGVFLLRGITFSDQSVIEHIQEQPYSDAEATIIFFKRL